MNQDNPCAACKTARPAMRSYRLTPTHNIALCEECRDALLRDVLEDGSPGFVEFLLKRAGGRVNP